MKWITHEAVALGAAYLLKVPPEAIVAVGVGSVLPDFLDMQLANLFPNRQMVFNLIHRGPTHWFGWWLAMLFAGLFMNEAAGYTMAQISGFHAVLFGTGFGALAHVGLDMCTVSGIPLTPWSRKNRISLGLCRTGSLREYAFLAVMIGLFGILARKDVMNIVGALRKGAGLN